MTAAKAREGRILIALGIAAALAAVATVLLARGSELQASDPAVRGALEAIVGLCAWTAVATAVMRGARPRRATDLALAGGIGVIAANSTLLVTLTALGAAGSAPAVAWLPVPARLVGAALLLAAGLGVGRRRRVQISALELAGAIALAALALAALGAGFGALRGSATTTTGPQIATIALYLAAAGALAMRARRAPDPTALWWYAGAAGALAVTRALFWLVPARGPDWVSPGDAARMAVAALLLLAVHSELGERRRGLQASSVEDERRRLAREFHDGLAQELAFIVNQSRRAVAGKADAESHELLAAAGQTALLDARQAIFKLNRRPTTMLSTAIVEHTMRIADRAGLALDVEVDGEVPVDREAEHEIVRIVGEAVSNAAKHANASRVCVAISSERSRVIVRISDNGEGFDTGAERSRLGFGLVSMSERTRSLGGRLHLESTPGAGTVIEVAI
jgi:signal transduction histidine kinase